MPVLQCLIAIVINSLKPCIPSQKFVLQMLIFYGFRSLPRQTQVPNSLLKLCSEALFGAQRRVVLPRRGCFQALLSGCTILPIISCSSLALSKCLQMMGQHRPIKVHTGRNAGCLGHFQKSMALRPCPQRRRLVHQLHSGRLLRHQVGCIICHPYLIYSLLRQHVRKVHLASGNPAGSSVMLGVMLSLDVTDSVNHWFLLHVACRGRAGRCG